MIVLFTFHVFGLAPSCSRPCSPTTRGAGSRTPRCGCSSPRSSASAVYAVRVIGPKVVAAGEPVVTRRQSGWFVLAVVAAVARLRLAGARHRRELPVLGPHGAAPAASASSCRRCSCSPRPTWLARLIVGDGWFGGSGSAAAAPGRSSPAVIFNAVVVFTHWPARGQRSPSATARCTRAAPAAVRDGAARCGCRCAGPLPELRLSLPAQMVYLFLHVGRPDDPGGVADLRRRRRVQAPTTSPYRLFGHRRPSTTSRSPG